jgi:glutamate/tyrosine decarboxylase-like PLP-dependent enzyme
MKAWSKKSQEEIKRIVFDALSQNINYIDESILGIPASHLDSNVFSQDASFLKDAPFMSTLVQNPNNIGCHTLGESESFFSGTQNIEREVLAICAEDILNCEEGGYDGYIASGGTEANIQAIWIYRNYFKQEFGAANEDIAILCSEDCHYSMDKAGNLLSIAVQKVEVTENTREILVENVETGIQNAKSNGKKYFIVVSNMMTTMYGSVDDVNNYTTALIKEECEFKLHIDAAYGGFYYPFSDKNSNLTFKNEHISSFTLDAHKMAQAPYGTGVFLIRKGLIQYANTKEASYVEGEDFTLIGSRSGANAVAVWMILMKNGPFGWQEKIFILQKRCQWMCEQLDSMGVDYYRNDFSNIITIRARFVGKVLAKKYGLVPDNHKSPKWFKIVIMDHVTIEKLVPLVEELKKVKEILV